MLMSEGSKAIQELFLSLRCYGSAPKLLLSIIKNDFKVYSANTWSSGVRISPTDCSARGEGRKDGNCGP